MYEYDQGGRLARATPETEWDPQQVAWLLALEAYEQGLCKQCGEPLDESTRIENDFNNPFATGRYVPVEGTPMQCHCCAALERSRRDTAALNPQFPAAMIHAVRLVSGG